MSVLLAAVTSIYFHIQIKKIKDGKTASDSLFSQIIACLHLDINHNGYLKERTLDKWLLRNHTESSDKKSQHEQVSIPFEIKSLLKTWNSKHIFLFVRFKEVAWQTTTRQSRRLINLMMSMWHTHSQEVRWSVSTMEYRRTLKTQILEHNCQLSVSTTQSLQNVVFAIFFPSRYPDTAIILLPVF